MDNDELEIRDMVEIKEEVIQEIDLTNFLFDEEQDDNRVGSSAGIMKANMCRTTDEEVDDTAKHVCKCKTTFKRRSSLEKHLKYCRLSSEYHLRKAEMLKNLEHIEINAAIMEAKNICFCCEESYAIESFHIGQIKCTDCLKSFKSQMSFERHIFISHSELNDFPCTICNAKLRSEILLKLHVNQHKKCGKLYACKICNKEFNCADYLKRHQTMSMCSQKKPLKCKECKKTFFGLDNIRAHIRSYHLGLQSSKKMEFVCTICKKSLSSAHNLNVHLRVHTGESPFDCDLCDKKFRSLELLRRHRPHHTGEKPYVCKECQRPFGTASNLSRHMKQHTGERPHVCSVCKKSYITKPQINRHMKTHLKNPHIKCAKHNNDISNEAAVFKCSVCQDPFWTKRHLDNHMELGCSLKYNERTDCTICKKNFDNSTTLRFHLTMVHKVDPEDYIKIGTNNDTETVVQPVVYILEGKNASKPANTEIANDYDSVVISSVIYKCENDPSNEIIFNRATDNIKIVDDDGNDLEESSSNENNCNINTCNSDDDVDEEDSKSLKCFIYEEDLSEEIKFNIITDIPSDNVDDKSGVKLAEEFKVDGIQSSISIVHSDAEFVNDENVVDANIIEIKEESS